MWNEKHLLFSGIFFFFSVRNCIIAYDIVQSLVCLYLFYKPEIRCRKVLNQIRKKRKTLQYITIWPSFSFQSTQKKVHEQSSPFQKHDMHVNTLDSNEREKNNGKIKLFKRNQIFFFFQGHKLSWAIVLLIFQFYLFGSFFFFWFISISWGFYFFGLHAPCKKHFSIEPNFSTWCKSVCTMCTDAFNNWTKLGDYNISFDFIRNP